MKPCGYWQDAEPQLAQALAKHNGGLAHHDDWRLNSVDAKA
ncbi:MAG TPA: hypothetical protein VGH22_08965 [Candidatus Binatia bacterium]|jgi:hypothetical protein